VSEASTSVLNLSRLGWQSIHITFNHRHTFFVTQQSEVTEQTICSLMVHSRTWRATEASFGSFCSIFYHSKIEKKNYFAPWGFHCKAKGIFTLKDLKLGEISTKKAFPIRRFGFCQLSTLFFSDQSDFESALFTDSNHVQHLINLLNLRLEFAELLITDDEYLL